MLPMTMYYNMNPIPVDPNIIAHAQEIITNFASQYVINKGNPNILVIPGKDPYTYKGVLTEAKLAQYITAIEENNQQRLQNITEDIAINVIGMKSLQFMRLQHYLREPFQPTETKYSIFNFVECECEKTYAACKEFQLTLESILGDRIKFDYI